MPHLAPRVVLSAAALLLAASPAVAVDFVRETVPHKWLERFTPEDLPAQKYPAYFDDFDKARFQSFTGRYKLSLLTLRKVKDPKPEQKAQLAIVRADSLSALGRWQQAVEAVSDPALADDPAVRVRRAKVLAGLGQAGRGQGAARADQSRPTPTPSTPITFSASSTNRSATFGRCEEGVLAGSSPSRRTTSPSGSRPPATRRSRARPTS
jgi:hypothetical protein